MQVLSYTYLVPTSGGHKVFVVASWHTVVPYDKYSRTDRVCWLRTGMYLPKLVVRG